MSPSHTRNDRNERGGREAAGQYPHACPVVEAVDRIGTEWRLVVLHVLQDGELRFNELEAETGGSSSTLSRVLDELEDAGLVDRRVEDRPLATYYSLTESGRRLGPVFDELACWATDNLQACAEGDAEAERGAGR